MEVVRSKRLWLSFCLGTVLVLSLVPLVHLLHSGNGSTGLADPAYVEDYYLPLTLEVAAGHPKAGNAWFFEHRDDINPRPYVAFWISAMPFLTAVPLSFAVALNFSAWSLALALLLYLLFR